MTCVKLKKKKSNKTKQILFIYRRKWNALFVLIEFVQIYNFKSTNKVIVCSVSSLTLPFPVLRYLQPARVFLGKIAWVTHVPFCDILLCQSCWHSGWWRGHLHALPPTAHWGTDRGVPVKERQNYAIKELLQPKETFICINNIHEQASVNVWAQKVDKISILVCVCVCVRVPEKVRRETTEPTAEAQGQHVGRCLISERKWM